MTWPDPLSWRAIRWSVVETCWNPPLPVQARIKTAAMVAAVIHFGDETATSGVYNIYLHGVYLTRAPLGRGCKYYPLPYFLDSLKTTADIDAKLSVHFPASF